eukprot:m.98250 g.98250  ORF g.98250 m.98250 type:complete len:1391 (+) comp9004_c0_seq1:210-4382(+)
MGVPFSFIVTIFVALASNAVAQSVKIWGDGGVFVLPGDALTGVSNTVIFDGSLSIQSSFCTSSTPGFDISYLANVEEITGYLKIGGALNCLSDIFPNLRIIRGWNTITETTLNGDAPFALSLDLTFTDPDPQAAVPTPLSFFYNLGLVSNGGIFVGGLPKSDRMTTCPYDLASGQEGVDLLNFLPGSTVVSMMSDTTYKTLTVTNAAGNDVVVHYGFNYQGGCLSCENSCNGVCFNGMLSGCQTLYNNSGACGTNGHVVGDASTCCPEMCTGGCTVDAMTMSYSCLSCANNFFTTTNRTCVSSCPLGTLSAGYAREVIQECIPFFDNAADLPTRRVTRHNVCVDSCDYNDNLPLFKENNSCVDVCASSNQHPTLPICLDPIEGVVPFKVCESVVGISYTCELLALEGENCDTIRGNIAIAGTTESRAMYATEREQNAMLKLRKIAGIASLSNTPFTTFDFLQNIEIIDNVEGQPNGLTVSNSPLLTSLNLQALRLVNGNTLVLNTPNLCYVSDIDFSRLNSVFKFFNLIFTQPSLTYIATPAIGTGVLCAGLECDPLCERGGNVARCWGPGVEGCQRCPYGSVLHEQSCVTSCPAHFFDNGFFCESCDSSCGNCTGSSPEECISCESVYADGKDRYFIDGMCLLSCGDGHYSDENNICHSCNTNCSQCSGSPGNCQGCFAPHFLHLDSSSCHKTCPPLFFGEVIARECHPCEDHCLECRSDSNCNTNCATHSICIIPERGYHITGGRPVLHTVCNSLQYQEAAPTNFTDTACASLTECEVGNEYIVTAKTSISDRVCETCTVCDPTYQAGAENTCVGFVNRECVLIDRCATEPCLNGGICASFNGTDFTCNCTSTNFCGETCDVELSTKGECPLLASSANGNKDIFVGVGIAVGIVAVLIIFVFVRFRYKEVKYNLRERYIRKRLKLDEWELDRRRIKFDKQIGKGQFGKVSSGYLLDEQSTSYTIARTMQRKVEQPVAIKELKLNPNKKESLEFVDEMNLLKKIGRHKYIVSLVGVCTLKSPMLLVMDIADLGDLINFVRKANPSLGSQRENILRSHDFVLFSAQICSGMAYLEAKEIIHRDLAARNVLVGGKLGEFVCKVNDFGLSLHGTEVVDDEERKLPLKWLAPECIKQRKFSNKTDVWAFGITMWEITSFGSVPYPGMKAREAYEQVTREGYRMGQFDQCPDDLYDAMLKCWQLNPANRPTFNELLVDITKVAGRSPGFFHDTNQGKRPSRMDSEVLRQVEEEIEEGNYELVHIPEDQVQNFPEEERKKYNLYKSQYSSIPESEEEFDEEDSGRRYLKPSRPSSTVPSSTSPSSSSSALLSPNIYTEDGRYLKPQSSTGSSIPEEDRTYLAPSLCVTDGDDDDGGNEDESQLYPEATVLETKLS